MPIYKYKINEKCKRCGVHRPQVKGFCCVCYRMIHYYKNKNTVVSW